MKTFNRDDVDLSRIVLRSLGVLTGGHEEEIHIGSAREDMEELMNTLEANVDEPIIERGTNARMAYGERYEVKFTKEDGVWKLQDLD